jgi:hypothetical protein
MKATRYNIGVLLSLLSLPVMLLVAIGGPASAASHRSAARAVTSSGLGTYKPTFAGPAATGCAKNCHLLTGPVNTPSTAAAASGHQVGTAGPAGISASGHAMPLPDRRQLHVTAAQRRQLDARNSSQPLPSVSCSPLRKGCDNVSTAAGGATAVKGLNAVDSATHTTNTFKDIEPPDQGLCAGHGYVVEHNNIGEILVFNTALKRESAPISDDAIMGLTKLGWSSGGDTSCVWDPANGGHWFFTEIVSASPESKGGAFTGCFAGVANECYEGIAVTDGSSPFGPYHVYFSNADYNPAEPGSPSLLNDFAKISVTRDAFLMFYDEFPLLPSTLPLRRRLLQRGPGIRIPQERAGAGPAHRPSQREAEPGGDGGEGEHGPAPHPGRDLRPRQSAARGRHYLLGSRDPGTAGRGPLRQQPRRHRIHAGLAGLLRVRGSVADFR